jgi:hypothetical protein
MMINVIIKMLNKLYTPDILDSTFCTDRGNYGSEPCEPKMTSYQTPKTDEKYACDILDIHVSRFLL